MAPRKIPFTPAQIRKALLDAQAQGVEIGEIRSHPDGSLSFVAKLAEQQPLEATDAATRAKAKSLREEQDLPKGVRFQPKTLKNGAVVRYGYYGKGKEAVSLGRLGTPTFDKAVKHLLGSDRRAPADGTLANLIYRYKTSADFARLRTTTQIDYRRRLDSIQEQFGRRTFEEIEARAFSAEIFAWRDTLARSPRQADYAVAVFKLLLIMGVPAWSDRHEQGRSRGQAVPLNAPRQLLERRADQGVHGRSAAKYTAGANVGVGDGPAPR